MNTLLINASVRGEESVSRSLSHRLAEKYKAKGSTITERDLTDRIDFVSGESLSAVGTPKDERTAGQAANETAKLADVLIKELQDADVIIMGVPIYNFGPPASVKAWADLVARAGTTFRYTPNGPEGLLEGKRAYIMAVSGGTPVGSDMDFMSSWLKFFLGFIGIHEVEIIAADGIFGQDGEEKVQAAHQKIESTTV
ncbi:MAG: NAD(P)H-dependent oxidoreductase [Cyanobacteria bacterium P01_D01_bin.36]